MKPLPKSMFQRGIFADSNTILQDHINSLALFYKIPNKTVYDCFDIFKQKWCGKYQGIEDVAAFDKRRVDAFYIYAIKALNLWMACFNGFDLVSWFDKYMDNQYFDDVKNTPWVASSY